MDKKETRGGPRKGAGRKPKYEKSSVLSVRFPDAVLDQLPTPKSDFIVSAVREKLKNEQASS